MAPSRVLTVGLALAALLSLAACAGIATEWLALGAASWRWRYRYVQEFSIQILPVALIVCAVTAGMLWAPVPRTKRDEWLLVVAWAIVAIGCQALLRSLNPFTLEQMFVSDGSNSFFSASHQHDALTVLRRFSAVRDAMPLHAQSNLPGKLMLHYALETLTSRPAVMAWLVVLLSNAGAFLMYAFVRGVTRDATIAVYSAVLYLFVPARIYFLPLMNTVTPLLVLACACLLMRWLQRGTLTSAVLLGSSLYLLIFFEPLPLVVGVLFAALTARAIIQGDLTPERLVSQGAVVIVALVATSELIHLMFGFELIAAFRKIRAHAAAFNQFEGRPYGVWLYGNLREFALGLGICQAVLYCAVLVDRLTAWRTWSARMTDPIAVLTIGAGAVLIATDLIGLNRGEVIRLWIFLACFFQIPAAYACARLNSRAAMMVVLGTTVLQAALGTAMIGFVVP